MKTASKLVSIALAETGYVEKASNRQLDDPRANPGRGNFTKYARDLHNAGYYGGHDKNGYPWCDSYVDHAFYELCDRDPVEAQKMTCQTGIYGAGCKYSAQYYRNQGRFGSKPRIGAQIFFGKKGAETHTGIVTRFTSARVYTNEGNTAPQSGVVANGGSVCNKSYPIGYAKIVGYGYPYYDAEVTVDGKWGRETTRALQKIFGTTQDGVISNQHIEYRDCNPGLRTGWEWSKSPNGNGSDLIRKMQEWAGMPAKDCDGEIGPKTIRALQKKLGTTVDGKVSKPSDMVKALQRWINEQ